MLRDRKLDLPQPAHPRKRSTECRELRLRVGTEVPQPPAERLTGKRIAADVLFQRLSLAPVAIALPRGNEDARLAIDRALSRLYGTDGFRAIYAKWFGEPDADTATFFRLSALPE